MQIIDYKYIHGSEIDEELGFCKIPELDRFKPSVNEFLKLTNLEINLTKPTAFLYVDGFSICTSDCGTSKTGDSTRYMPAMKAGIGFIINQWVRTFNNLEHLKYVHSISSTCAAGVHAIYEAHKLLYSKFVDQVILIGGERITSETIRMFKEVRVDILCGDGFAYFVLERTPGENPAKIINPVWRFSYHGNPFTFSPEEILSVKPEYPVDYVKLHATGTASNEDAESLLREIATPIEYKSKIGHTQGISALVETGMLLDDDYEGTILVTANGFGGFYGAFTLLK